MRAIPLFLILALALTGCESSPDTPPEAGEPGQPGAGGAGNAKKPPKPTNLLAENERSQLYFDLDQYTGRYMTARDQGNARAYTSLHASVLMPMVERNIDELTRTVRDPEQMRYRIIAARALGFGSDLSGDRIVPALVSVLEDKNVNLANSALVSLYLLGWAETPIAPIVTLLNHPDLLLRSNGALAISAVLRAKRKEAEDRIEMTMEIREASGRLMALAMNPDEDAFVRAHSASALGNIGDPASADVLLNLLLDQYQVVRIHSAQGLGNLGQESAILPLINALKVTESRNEARIIVASLEEIATALDYPVDKEALGTEEENWRAWYAAIKAGK